MGDGKRSFNGRGGWKNPARRGMVILARAVGDCSPRRSATSRTGASIMASKKPPEPPKSDYSRPRMLTEAEIEMLRQKQRETNELWPNLKYLP